MSDFLFVVTSKQNNELLIILCFSIDNMGMYSFRILLLLGEWKKEKECGYTFYGLEICELLNIEQCPRDQMGAFFD